MEHFKGMTIAWKKLIVAITWPPAFLKVGVALYFGNPSPWSSTNEKGIDSFVAWLIPTISLPDILTKPKRFERFALGLTNLLRLSYKKICLSKFGNYQSTLHSGSL